MIIELKNSGLPITMDKKTGKLFFNEQLNVKNSSTKILSQMKGLFKNDKFNDDDEPIYEVYRDIAFPNHKEIFLNNKIQYDITVINEGLIGNERKKTSGHYHSWNEMRTFTYPEVYEVIHGTAIYILQRADNFENPNYEHLHVEDIIVVKVEAGQSIIIPPNYGHCSVNGGEDILVFSNLAYTGCKVDYNPVKYYHGLGVYVVENEGKINFEVNENYYNLPKIKFATVKENKELGIEFNKPIYKTFVNEPEKFDFLRNVDPYVNEIMNMLDMKEEIIL